MTRNLQEAVDYTLDYLDTWRIKVNPLKCETILFRKPYQLSSADTRQHWKLFKVSLNGTNCILKPTVKYLGINLDKFLYFDKHIDIQIGKANAIFHKNRRLFCSPLIAREVKYLAYKSLVRPILTYGCPIWWNIGPHTMERVRVFERKCLRYCYGMHRTARSEYKHYITNQIQYNKYGTDRIDIKLLEMVRNHIARSTSDDISNSLIYGPYTTTEDHISQRDTAPGKTPPPGAFIYLDKRGYIQDERTRLPKIYHIERRINNKGFEPQKFESDEYLNTIQYKFNTVKNHNPQKELRKRQNYWWLQQQQQPP